MHLYVYNDMINNELEKDFDNEFDVMSAAQSISTVMLLLWLLFSVEVNAADTTRYVNDHLIVTVRAGAGGEYKVLKSVPSGTRLELLEQIEGSDFTKVRTEDGTEGWVRSWYLRDTPTAKLLLDDATQKAEQLAAENKKLLVSNDELKQANSSMEKQLHELKGKHERLSTESDKLKEVASRPIELESENKRLTSEAVQIKEENQRLSIENNKLRQSSVQKWFMAGSGVLLVGILVGLILPKFRRQRGSNW